MATNKQIRISITSALNAAGIEATKEQVESMAKSVSKSMGDAAKQNRTHWADIKAAWDMGLSAIRYVGGMIRDALKKAFDAEYALTNFKTMLGSLDAAKQHVAELKQFAAQTPLTFGDLSQASKTLLAFGADVKTVMPSLKMLGDISLGNAERFQSLSLAFGKVTSEGKLTGVTLKQMIIAGFNPLQEIAAKTGATMDDLKAQMEKGEISFDLVKAAMKSATSEGGRFHDAMKDASQTGAGLFSTMQDNWNATVTKFGGAFANAAKGGLSKMIETLQRLNNDGTIDVWASKVAAACDKVVGAVKVAAEWGSKLWAAFRWVQDQAEQGGAYIGGVIGTKMAGGSWSEAFKNGERAMFDTEREQKDTKKEEAEKEAKIRAEAAKKAVREAAEAKQKQAEKEASIEEVYAKERAKAKEAEDKKAAEKKVEQEKKAAEKAAAERARLDAQEAARRERERQKELADKIKDHQKLLAAERAEEAKSRSAISAAESKLQQAWGWYRDKDSMAAQLEEEKADAEARKQFEKDFARLKDRRRDWRKAENLSVDDEAVRRVALAREEKEAAERHLAEIEKNTAELAEKLDELLQAK
ncbi:MAG: tape measure protein [Kiritimatiellae bacterium]|nr:tape measure protein [Kiritimatiellia bacterium]